MGYHTENIQQGYPVAEYSPVAYLLASLLPKGWPRNRVNSMYRFCIMRKRNLTRSALEVSCLTGMRNPFKTARAPPIKRNRSPPESVGETDANYIKNEKEFHLNMELLLQYRGNNLKVKIEVRVYEQNKNLAIRLYSKAELGFEPLCMLTANTAAACPKDCALVNTNTGIDGLLEWIEQNNLAVPTGEYVRSGYLEYPEYRFDSDALRELDPEGYAEYLDIISQRDD